MEYRSLIEAFTDLEEAFHYMDHKLLEYMADNWSIRSGTSIERVGTKWRVGILMSRGEEDKTEEVLN